MQQLPDWIVFFRDRYRILMEAEPAVKHLRNRDFTDAYRALIKEGKHIQKFCMAKDSGTVEQRLAEIHQPVQFWLREEARFAASLHNAHIQLQMSDGFSRFMDVLEMFQ